MICTRSLNFSDHVFPSCFLGARIDLSAEDEVVALVLAECSACPYVELLKSGILGPSNLKPTRRAVHGTREYRTDPKNRTEIIPN